MEGTMLISDAAKEVHVESHVLRYWEEELKLPIKRNGQGHRYYTEADVETFKQIKEMKERGLQLKAIKMILQDGKFEILNTKEEVALTQQGESREEKAQRLQWILQTLIKQVIEENNKELVSQVRESVVKELDYQFRMQEEREEVRVRLETERSEEYYRKMDELLRKKSGANRWRFGKKDKEADLNVAADKKEPDKVEAKTEEKVAFRTENKPWDNSGSKPARKMTRKQKKRHFR